MSGRIESYFMPKAIFQEIFPSVGRGDRPFYVEEVIDPSPSRVEFWFEQKGQPPLLGEGMTNPSRTSINTHLHFHVLLLIKSKSLVI